MHEKEMGKNIAIHANFHFKKIIYRYMMYILKHLTKYVSMLDESQILDEYYPIWLNLFYGSMDIA